MKRKVYLLVNEDTFQGELHLNLFCFGSKKKAVTMLKKMRDSFIKDNDITNYNIDEDDDDCFDCYMKGWYSVDRFVCYILEEEIY